MHKIKKEHLFCCEKCDILESVDTELLSVDRILIIELKKGGFKMSQAEEYIESIYYGNKLNAKPQIRAFVIGDSIDSAISKFKTQEDFGKLYAYTYDQLVRNAEKRFFNLKSKLEEHYNQFAGEDYVKAILNEPEQLRLPGL